MSLKVRASAVSHLSMTFKQTTHFAVLLSLLESWECVRHRNAGKRRCGLLRPVLREAYRPPTPDARTILLAALYQHIFDWFRYLV
jgi:hypothetical protein